MTREEQIELMKECLEDAHEAFKETWYDGSFWDGNGEAAIAAVFSNTGQGIEMNLEDLIFKYRNNGRVYAATQCLVNPLSEQELSIYELRDACVIAVYKFLREPNAAYSTRGHDSNASPEKIYMEILGAADFSGDTPDNAADVEKD